MCWHAHSRTSTRLGGQDVILSRAIGGQPKYMRRPAVAKISDRRVQDGFQQIRHVGAALFTASDGRGQVETSGELAGVGFIATGVPLAIFSERDLPLSAARLANVVRHFNFSDLTARHESTNPTVRSARDEVQIINALAAPTCDLLIWR
jgi:hypothetical protein